MSRRCDMRHDWFVVVVAGEEPARDRANNLEDLPDAHLIYLAACSEIPLINVNLLTTSVCGQEGTEACHTRGCCEINPVKIATALPSSIKLVQIRK